MTSLNGDIKVSLGEDGYAVVRGVFSQHEIAQMRSEAKALLASGASPVNGGLNSGSAPDQSDLVHRLLRDPRLAPFCAEEHPYKVHVHADTHNDWHTDLAPTRTPEYSIDSAWIYKMVIYLQDHPDRDGLVVMPGSHKANARRACQHIGTRAGDIIIFDTRMRHAGRLPSHTERLFRNVASSLYRVGLLDYHRYQLMLRRLQRFLPNRPERLAIFVASALFDRYAALSFDEWKRDRTDLRRWRILRPPPWAMVP